MGLPTDLTTITITGTFIRMDGSPVIGSVEFTTSTVLVDDVGDRIIFPAVITSELDANGSFAVDVPATNDPQYPGTYTWRVAERFSDGRVYHIEVPHDSPGGELDLSEVAPVPPASPFAASPLTDYPRFGAAGPLTVRTGGGEAPVFGAWVIGQIRATVGTAPTGSAVVVDVNVNRISIYGTQANRPAIAPGTKSATGGAASVTALVDGDVLSVDIDQVGSGVPGSDLVVSMQLRKA